MLEGGSEVRRDPLHEEAGRKVCLLAARSALRSEDVDTPAAKFSSFQLITL